MAIQDKLHLGDINKLTYLWDALKGGPAMYVIKGFTPTEKINGEAIKHLKDHYDYPRVSHHKHVWRILQSPIMEGNNQEVQ